MNRFRRFEYIIPLSMIAFLMALPALWVGCTKSTDADHSSNGDAGGQDAGETPLCQLPFEVGPCDGAIPVYWYNAAIGKCEQKTYGGCQGNENRFDNLDECEQACRTGGSDAGGQDAGETSLCELPFEPGPCEAAIQVYWYNADKEQCEQKTYGGCQGNENRFDSIDECEQACRTGGSDAGGQDTGETSLCELPFVAGPCKADFPVYWYNAATGKCEQRTYGGCQGNENRFDSLDECEQACLDPGTVACESDSDCGWGEIGHEIQSASDCICLYGCPYLPLNRTTIDRRLEQHSTLCDPMRDGMGQMCGIDDCVRPPPAECVDKRCTGDLYGEL